MKISTLYAKYDVMPQLITHQLRVAGIAKVVAENWVGKCDVPTAIRLALVHDMGNIVKFDLSDSVDRTKFGTIENLAGWRLTQRKYWNLYGKDAHTATIGILRDAKLDEFVAPIEEEAKLYFAEARGKELFQASLPAVILMYADCRVTPNGVTSYRERIDDLKTRYGGATSPTWHDWTYWFEAWMQQNTGIDLQEINEKKISQYFAELLTYDI